MSDTNAEIPPAPMVPDKEMDVLIAKHRAEINRAKELDSASQQELFSELGVDPKALESHYAALQQKDLELRQRDARADRKVVGVTWASFGAAVAAATAFTQKFKPPSKLVRWFSVALAGMAAALGGSFAASRMFAGRTRAEGRELDKEARTAFERELAVALENRERESKAAQPLPVAPAPVEASAGMAANVPKRDASFAAQATADKATTVNIQVNA